MPDPKIGSKLHFDNMLEQAVLAEKLRYSTISIPEHHLVNILMMPSPLQMAVKIASITKNKYYYRNSSSSTARYENIRR